MSILKVSFEETLGKFVLPTLCIGCASCVVICPFNCLDYVDGKPKVVKECKVCGICAQVCPKYNISIPDLEKFVFGRERKKDEEFGIYRRIVIAQTRDEDLMKVCQDGGVVTTLLKFALENGIIDGAVASGVSMQEPLKPVPKMATTLKEIIECAGTRYTYSPNILAFKEGIQQRKKSIAFVGTPCQIHALRKIQMIPLKKYADALNFTVGLFCSESFTYEGFVGKLIREKLNIDPNDVKKVNIKGKLLIATRSGEVTAVPLKEVKEYASNCETCVDFSAELADISVGGLGLNNWTLTILRTERGEEVFQKAESVGLLTTRPIGGDKSVLDLLVKISRKKGESATKVTR